MAGNDKEQIVREALDWLIELQEESHSADVHARFSIWLSTSPVHVGVWNEVQHTWKLREEALPRSTVRQRDKIPENSSFSSLAQGSHAQPRVSKPGRRLSAFRLGPRRWRPLHLAAPTVAVCALLLVLLSLQGHLQSDYVSRTGEIRQLQLEDGSVVHLGPGGAMTVAYDAQVRRVSILAGEAFFTVVSDPHRPFIVTSGQLEATAVGTAFNVRFSPTRPLIAVRQGIVKVASHSSAVTFEDFLHSGEWVRVSWDEKTFERGVVPPEQIAAWLQRQLLVKDWTISEVVAELRHYHHGLIVLTDEKFGTMKVTGVYDLHNPIESLRAVAQPYAFVVREVTLYVVILSTIIIETIRI